VNVDSAAASSNPSAGGRSLHIVLVEPEIAPNTGSIGRLCAATHSPLHLIEPLGFTIDDRHLRRAGLDYWPYVEVHRHQSWEAFQAARPGCSLRLFSARATRPYTACDYRPGDFLVFGGESKGLPQALRDAHPDRLYTIPMASPHVRSLNLANAASIVLYEALRQLSRTE
jgi:tRNA (cytidine/uridine-2'-O-)-methyltransferase